MLSPPRFTPPDVVAFADVAYAPCHAADICRRCYALPPISMPRRAMSPPDALRLLMPPCPPLFDVDTAPAPDYC